MRPTNVVITQHAVGQGGLSSGLVKGPHYKYHWVYDCGSENGRELEREIQKIKINGAIDCLFISHLDSDHINGIEFLLNEYGNIKEVVLPYCNEEILKILLVKECLAGNLSPVFIDFVRNPSEWLRNNGVENISYIMPHDYDGESEVEPFTPPPLSHEVVPARVSWSNTDEHIDKTTIIRDGHMSIRDSDMKTLLEFIPYAHQPSSKKINDFFYEIRSNFGKNAIQTHNLLEICKDESKRNKLKECYNRIWKVHNLVSMSLLVSISSNDIYIEQREGMSCLNICCWLPYIPYFSWLLTGDSKLSGKDRPKKFLDYYKRYLDKISFFNVPHHGSKKDFDEHVAKQIPNGAQFVISASQNNSYGHPHNEITHMLLKNGRRVHWVSDDPQSQLSINISFR